METLLNQTALALRVTMKKPTKKPRYTKPDSVKVLEDLENKNMRSKAQNFPYPVKAHYEDKTANGLTKCVIAWIRLHGGQAERINTMGRPVETSDGVRWLRSTSTIGSADISATISGRSVKIEIKIGTDRQSEAQKKYQQDIENAGGIYLIIKCFDDFYMWWHEKGCRL